MEEVVGVAAPEAGDAEGGVGGHGGRQPTHQRAEARRRHQVARHRHAAAAFTVFALQTCAVLPDLVTAGAFAEVGKKGWLFAQLQPGRARKRINAT